MRLNSRLTSMLVILLLLCICLFACEKKKPEGKVLVTEKEFALERDGKVAFSLNVKGKVKNVGAVDVKNIVVSGRCNTCGEMLISGKWFVSEMEQTPEQKDAISYLAAGGEERFQFKGIAYYFSKAGESPSANPEGLEVYIESFETVEK
jgi:hypothetical protein